MDIDELLMILEKSKSEKLQKISEDFYDRIKERIKELEDLKKSAESDEEIIIIEDEIRALRRILRGIFEARTRRIIHAAWAEVCETEIDEELENMTEAEKNLFKKLVEILDRFKRLILEQVREEEEVEKEEEGYVMVRIKKDIPEFEGVDGKTYKLRREDVVVLPALNAKALIKGGVAEVIEVKR
jgi:DNA replication factor GINS